MLLLRFIRALEPERAPGEAGPEATGFRRGAWDLFLSGIVGLVIGVVVRVVEAVVLARGIVVPAAGRV